MKSSIALERRRDDIRRIVARDHGANVRVCGSVLTGTDREDGDQDRPRDHAPTEVVVYG